VAAYGALQFVTGAGSLSDLALLVARFGCFGLLLGAIFAFDANSEFKGVNRPVVRVAVGAIAGLALALLWHWPIEGVIVAVVLAAFLGYLGMSWAKYVDF
jgi:hypothetical protein